MPLKEAQELVRKISYETHKSKVYTSALFVTLMAEQVGQVAEKYMDQGRHAKEIEVDITDVILVCLAYLNWLEADTTKAFSKSLAKHQKAIDLFEKQNK